MSKNKEVHPFRTCVICRKRLVKATLDRYIWESGSAVVVKDGQQNMPGRGAYCCRNNTCRERFKNHRKGWKKFFRLT